MHWQLLHDTRATLRIPLAYVIRHNTQLLTLVQDWLFESGHREIWLVATPDPGIRAYGFYRYLGLEATGELSEGEEKMVLHAAGKYAD